MINTVRMILLIAFVSLLVACGKVPATKGNTQQPTKLQVVATTTIVGDVVEQIAGDAVDLVVLLPLNADPHSFQPTPQDVALIAKADLVFANGAGLETFMQPLLGNMRPDAKLVEVSGGIPLLKAPEHNGVASPNDNHPQGDPHVWMDPTNVQIWSENIAATLSEADPDHATNYQTNAAQYQEALLELDTWIRQQVTSVPEAKRKLVTDHLVMGYFAQRYGFTQVGAIIPGFSTQAEPSAQEMAALEDTMRQLEVRAIFTSQTANPALAQRLAKDIDVRLVPLYTGSLSGSDGPASSYLDYMRYNVEAIVTALE